MRTRARQATQFAVCIDNRGYDVSLEVGKLYRVIADEESSRRGYIRVVDESGEDYGYSVERFIVMPVPQPVARALSRRPQRPAHRPAKLLQPAAVKARRG